ncbi:MAG: alkaline phosphatase D family protein [Rubrobacter sp.]|nr:alkaline phosphatase D family protein [Rubrobacter sp.]
MSEAEARSLFAVRRINPVVFPQSVASGDPQPKGIVLWTRLRSLSSGNQVAYEIARDTTFRNPVLRGAARTSADKDNTLKVQLNNRSELKPFTTYYYRFIYNGNVSRTGCFKTLPAPTASVDRVRFGYISCQDYTNGFYTALSHLAEEPVDFIVHLGDYIYETTEEGSFQSGQVRPIEFPSDKNGTSDPNGNDATDVDNALEADTVEDYRFLYKTYKSDRNLQRLHERFAFLTIWDDHEFANDCYGANALDADGTAPSENGAGEPVPNPDAPRRSAANRVWAEFTPVGLVNDLEASPDSGKVRYEPGVEDPVQEIEIYRSFAFGNLMELVLTDERLYRDEPPCGLDTLERLLTPGCEEIKAEGRTMLGTTQRDYFINKMTGSDRTWKVWGNETMFMQLKIANSYVDALRTGATPPPPEGPLGSNDGVYFNLDQWDGYQDERNKIAEAFNQANEEKGVQNFVVITGDLHTFIAGYARENYDEPSAPEVPPTDAVGVCFMGGSVTSSNLIEIATFGRGPTPPPVPGPGPNGGDAFTAQTQTANPHIVYLDSTTHGYNLIEVTPQKLTCTMREVSTIKSPQASVETLKVFEVPAGEIKIVEQVVPTP